MKSAPAPVARPANAALPALVLLFNAFIWGTNEEIGRASCRERV